MSPQARGDVEVLRTSRRPSFSASIRNLACSARCALTHTTATRAVLRRKGGNGEDTDDGAVCAVLWLCLARVAFKAQQQASKHLSDEACRASTSASAHTHMPERSRVRHTRRDIDRLLAAATVLYVQCSTVLYSTQAQD